ncbi:hypothetical protein AVEN_227358-1 [Araneus ventricosus]|uniref:Uncharacterized protein n=1 Tax=Araneus ventricosus TaxID=182803 RepID=A0A4Y2GVV1_ARAVE|nr:hypothetical protein AVEN_227358-1 [Araneus ventricosus]
MDTYSDLFDELDSIDWEKETTPAAAFNYEDGELSYSPDLPNFDEMTSIPSPISPIHSPAMHETNAADMNEPPRAIPSQKEPAMDYEPNSPPAIPSQKEPAVEYEPTSVHLFEDGKPLPENDCKTTLL